MTTPLTDPLNDPVFELVEGPEDAEFDPDAEDDDDGKE